MTEDTGTDRPAPIEPEAPRIAHVEVLMMPNGQVSVRHEGMPLNFAAYVLSKGVETVLERVISDSLPPPPAVETASDATLRAIPMPGDGGGE